MGQRRATSAYANYNPEEDGLIQADRELTKRTKTNKRKP